MDLKNELYQIFVKILIPAFVAVTIKLSVTMKKQRLTFQRVIISYIVGAGSSYFLYPFIVQGQLGKYESIAIALLAITSEKMMEFLLFKWNIDSFLTDILNGIKNLIIKSLGGKND